MAKALLGISPGTRIIGLAIIKKSELVEWRVKTFKGKWSLYKQESILYTIERLCDYYDVEMISVKKIDPLRSSVQLDRLQAAITLLAEKKQIKAVQYSLSDLDYDLRTGRKQTKGNLSEQVADKHPVLRSSYLREQNNRKEYYTKMFEAIAMAERCRE